MKISKNLLLVLFFALFGSGLTLNAQQWLGSSNASGSIYRRGNVGIGLTTPGIAPLDVRGDNIYLAPPGTSGFSSKFIGIGESGGECPLYGMRVQLQDNNFINMGIKTKFPSTGGPFDPFPFDDISKAATISWGDTTTPLLQCFPVPCNFGQPRPLNFEFDGNDEGCGTRVAAMFNPNATYQFRVFGDALANNWVPSDARYKSNVKNINSADDILSQLRGVTYNMKQNEFPHMNFRDGRVYGFIAQELKEVMPEAVKEDYDGYYAVQYTAIVPVLVEGYKAQKETIEAQNEVIEQQNQNIAEMRRELDEIKAMLSGNSLKSSRAGEGLNSFSDVKLFQNQPNPFNQETTIRYSLSQEVMNAEIQISDLSGKVYKTFNLDQRGEGSVTLQAGSLSAGTYIYTMVVDGNKVDSRRMVLNK